MLFRFFFLFNLLLSYFCLLFFLFDNFLFRFYFALFLFCLDNLGLIFYLFFFLTLLFFWFFFLFHNFGLLNISNFAGIICHINTSQPFIKSSCFIKFEFNIFHSIWVHFMNLCYIWIYHFAHFFMIGNSFHHLFLCQYFIGKLNQFFLCDILFIWEAEFVPEFLQLFFLSHIWIII